MSLFSKVESGTSWNRSKFSKSISKAIRYDCRFHECIPVLKKFMLPGDVAKIGGDVLVRFHPMLSPTLTRNTFRVRYFFVPLRLLEEDTELIITGSKNGKLFEESAENPLPTFKNFVDDADKVTYPNAFKVSKWSFWDYMRCQVMDYESIKSDECLPSQYWYKGYFRIKFDYYRDENYDSEDDFDTAWATEKLKGVDVWPFFSHLKKDYFTSALPWQLKAAAAPTLSFNVGPGSLGLDFSDSIESSAPQSFYPIGVSSNKKLGIPITGNALHFGQDNLNVKMKVGSQGFAEFGDEVVGQGFTEFYNAGSPNIKEALNEGKIVGSTVTTGFDTADVREMFALTRIEERLARCGSRYTEYLRANFGMAPADGTLQRAQYLGGWSVPIVTTEVLQTGQGTDPVGTMRGHGITRGGNRIQTFHCKEFGLLFGLAEVRPDIEYTTGIPRELTYKRRWDFFNPSFQHLSEQEVRKGELFIGTDGENDNTLGFQAYANELRTAQDETVGDLRDTMSYWCQALHFSSRPNITGLIGSENHLSSFNAPFVGSGNERRPIIVVFQNILTFYRPMVRYATPGLVDHL